MSGENKGDGFGKGNGLYRYVITPRSLDSVRPTLESIAKCLRDRGVKPFGRRGGASIIFDSRVLPEETYAKLGYGRGEVRIENYKL